MSKIEWTDETWNPIVGCSVVSPGCTNCYAMRLARRLDRPGSPYHGTTQSSKAGPVWSGKVAPTSWKRLTAPLGWRRPRRVFVNSMGDLFHEDVPDDWIDRIFAVMALCPQHRFQVLTKRSGRMRAYLTDPDMGMRVGVEIMKGARGDVGAETVAIDITHDLSVKRRPLPNVWLGVSAEDQRRADERIPDLLATPAAVRFISAEPLLGHLQLDDLNDGYKLIDALRGNWWHDEGTGAIERGHAKLDWVICGGESGPGARPMHPEWARSLRDQCNAAGVAFFFKQWGAWEYGGAEGATFQNHPEPVRDVRVWPDGTCSNLVGKKRAGRLLDGREWNEYPEAADG